MSLWAIVPVKPFARAKSRLAGVLSPEERAGLGRAFLDHALEVLAGVPAVTQTLVISRDSLALAMARERGAHTVLESGRVDLNRSLARATEAALALGATSVLILPTDLPLLSAGDLQTLAAGPARGPLVAIAPDRREEGTNALLVRPPGLIAYSYGARSFQRHLEQAWAAGAQVHICRQAGLALDVDRPDDWLAYQAEKNLSP